MRVKGLRKTKIEKGPKFAPAPGKIPTKDIVAEVEAAIVRLPDDTKDSIRTATASILHRARLPPHNNISKAERKALQTLKEDVSRVIMKADKGNCFVVMDRIDYNEKMENLLSDHQTYQLVHKPPFAKIERELNHNLLDLKKKGKINDPTIYKLRSTDAIPPAINIRNAKLYSSFITEGYSYTQKEYNSISYLNLNSNEKTIVSITQENSLSPMGSLIKYSCEVMSVCIH